MAEQTKALPTSDERILAGIAHFFGWMAALVVWALQKDKSRFVRFQAVQAMAFDFLVMLISTIFFSCVFAMMFLGGGVLMWGALTNANQPANLDWILGLPMFMPFTLMACIFPYSFVLLAIRIFAAVSVLSGRDFRYPWLGKQTEKLLME